MTAASAPRSACEPAVCNSLSRLQNGVDKATTTPFSTRNGHPTRDTLARNETRPDFGAWVLPEVPLAELAPKQAG